MAGLRKGVVLLAVFLLCPLGVVQAEADRPWAFNAPRAEGYAIDLVQVEPAPGTPLVAGSVVEFQIAVRYTLAVTSEGSIILVFQDDKNRDAKKSSSQVMQSVTGPSGELTLKDTVTVPRRAKELRLFVPLMPKGMAQTTGEVTIRYPVVRK